MNKPMTLMAALLVFAAAGVSSGEQPEKLSIPPKMKVLVGAGQSARFTCIETMEDGSTIAKQAWISSTGLAVCGYERKIDPQALEFIVDTPPVATVSKLAKKK